MADRLRYWRRVAAAYLLPTRSHLSFWHESPAANPRAAFDRLGPYYMTFADKARYAGPFDAQGVPLLDYHGDIGPQYNPIAVAQYGLAHHALWLENGGEASRRAFLAQADWLALNLEDNGRGLAVWMHHFDFEYRTLLKGPWYSGLAQGQGISLLARAHAATQESRYRNAMRSAYRSFTKSVSEGGVLWKEPDGSCWIEEYIVPPPPTHILNGFIWALWGIRDYFLATGDAGARALFDACAATLKKQLPRYDTGWWSLYELSQARLPMLASPFYHRLHVTQLRILAGMTAEPSFGETADRWEGYASRLFNRTRSLIQKSAFKLLYY